MTTENANISDLTFARKMVEKYRDMLLQCAGLRSITIDGQMVMYADVEAGYRQWQKAVARLSGTRPNAVTIDMSNAQ